MDAPRQRSHWLIPATILVVAVLLLVALHELVGGPDLSLPGGSPPDEAVVEAVRTAPADPFRYGGRTVGDVLNRIEPRTGWADAGWSVRALTGDQDGYRAERSYIRKDGAKRSYDFTVGPDLDRVWPANGLARSLMHQGPRPDS